MLGRIAREPRVARICTVEIQGIVSRQEGVTGNISRGGVYVWTDTPPPVGAVVALGITIAPDKVARVLAQVIHVLLPEEASALGRRPGAGFHFIEEGTPALAEIARMLDEIGEPAQPQPCRILLADGSPRLLDRLASALGECGFDVTTELDGVAAYAACQGSLPQVVIVSDELALLDGWAIAAQLRTPIERGELAILILSDHEPDAQRLTDLGLDPARHWLQKPFTDGDIQKRVCELVAARRPPAGLRVNLGELSLGTLLAFFEHEQKSGIATATRGAERVRLHISNGRIARVAAADPRAAVLALLDWEDGELEFRSGEVEPGDALGCSISRLLFDHARLIEERPTAVRSVESLLN